MSMDFIKIRGVKFHEEDVKQPKYLSKKGKELLFSMIREIWGLTLSREDLEYGIHGKPYLKNYPDLHFNISHSGRWVVCGVGSVPLGIDVQEHRPLKNPDRLAKKILSEDEAAMYEQLSEEEKMRYFYDCWSEKEARVKGTGEGISHELNHLPDMGFYEKINLDENYSCGLWMEEHRKIVIEKGEEGK